MTKHKESRFSGLYITERTDWLI